MTAVRRLIFAMTRIRSVLLLSGGLDSAANLAFCSERDTPVLALTVHYGQRAALREIEAARELCRYYSVEHQVLELPFLGALGGSSLTDSAQSVPTLQADELDARTKTEATARQVWVPNRNGVLINAAAALAERAGAKRVVVGFNAEEATTFPDNTQEFLDAATRSLAYSTSNQVEVFCYTTQWNKREIARELLRLRTTFPREKVWSCYHGGEKPCGECESCRRFTRAWEGVRS